MWDSPVSEMKLRAGEEGFFVFAVGACRCAVFELGLRVICDELQSAREFFDRWGVAKTARAQRMRLERVRDRRLGAIAKGMLETWKHYLSRSHKA